MAQLSIDAQVRNEAGKGAARRLRRAGRVPGIVYGKKVDNIGVSLDGPTLEKLLHQGGSSGLVELNMAEGTQVVLIKDVQNDPVLGDVIHVDFHAVALDEEVLVTVSLYLSGEGDRADDGGIVAQALREISVYCLPTAIPEWVEVDISGLTIGDSIAVGEITLPEGVRLDTDPEETVVSVVLPTEEPEEPETAAEEEVEGEEAAEGEGEEAEAEETDEDEE